MYTKHSSYREKAQELFNHPELFKDYSSERLFGFVDCLRALDTKPEFPNTEARTILEMLELIPDNVKSDTYYIFKRRMRHLYNWYIHDHNDNPQFRRAFQLSITKLIRNRRLSDAEKNKLALLAKYYDEHKPGVLDFEWLVHLFEKKRHYDTLGAPAKQQIGTLNYLAEMSDIVKNSLPESFTYIESMMDREIITDANVDKFYERVLEENDGSPHSVFYLFKRWFTREEAI